MSNRLSVLSAATVVMVCLASSAALSQGHGASEHTYYDVSEDPQLLELLALSDAGKVGHTATMDVIDVFRSPRLMLASTWRIDCPAERMAIVQTTRVQPGAPVQQADVTPQPISARASAKSWRVFQLACTGKGGLIERRVYRGNLPDIVGRFWGAVS